MAQSFVALITVLSDPPYPSQGPGFPTHPIAPGGPPLGFWGGRPPEYVDIGGPGPQPHPEHPIAPGGKPPYPSQGPGFPTPPIYFPPPGSKPPLGIWGGRPPEYVDIGGPGPQPHPEHPIVLPPDLPPTIPPEGGQPERPIDWKVGWTAQTGWVVIGIPQFPVVTPSSKK
jgi:hypothetical protein